MTDHVDDEERHDELVRQFEEIFAKKAYEYLERTRDRREDIYAEVISDHLWKPYDELDADGLAKVLADPAMLEYYIHQQLLKMEPPKPPTVKEAIMQVVKDHYN